MRSDYNSQPNSFVFPPGLVEKWDCSWFKVNRINKISVLLKNTRPDIFSEVRSPPQLYDYCHEPRLPTTKLSSLVAQLHKKEVVSLQWMNLLKLSTIDFQKQKSIANFKYFAEVVIFYIVISRTPKMVRYTKENNNSYIN